ncbi:lysophospholipid transporter LplT [Comamonas sp. NLF-1-9]|uniref:lysophospholipid transporter LplT n=1 Tax=Comamonas sp. NLF-1-9 TaxID=2853163 RepID=UPI001C47703C|nr:lysophospholipid transporter LplT [Comamonas sp. NLF-1-9]QXL83782.1 lysophospholipid transporter LplT [Comamonas sp. NLF-1-9]
MKRGFYTIMSAQFFSSLADNALFVVAVELLRTDGAPAWQAAALVPMFALFYVLLAPWVGAFADSLPKGRVMFYSNAVKALGCVLMLVGSHPLLAYGVVGLGAAAYSPAKYGILTELLPASRLVKANGWIEGLTIASIILGVVLGGQLVAPEMAELLLAGQWPGVELPAEGAILALIPVYLLAGWFNLHIPLTRTRRRPMPRNPLALLPDFRECNRRLWRDKLGQISLASTTLFWGVSGNLRYVVLAWAAAALGYGTTKAAALVGVVALGTASGAVFASLRIRLDRAPRVIPWGIGMGVLVMAMNLIDSIWVAVPFLVFMGALGGFLVVPMNALLQHRGHHLMGAGRSIAVQNFNEQLAILLMGAAYSAASSWGLSAFGAVTAFGATVTLVMWLIQRWYAWNLRTFREEMSRLKVIARRDK